ncbi:translation initiation factor IF-2 [Nonlabens dokdonensis]|uniref:Translation initiation factor IF-2 n=1 Tax=Nonlabens dokdonensis TaxID=328515 RepID=A0A1Z8BJQ2_9FLAO|nr:translation initiation factor IF-2 [Nonlabens dokdonensis]OUS22821.1 translation initiation factor IF-2 [Nonlabens dokdonensis]
MTIKQLKNSLSIIALLLIVSQGFAQENRPVKKQKVDELVSTKIAMDKAGDFKDRFTIQLFYGERNKAIATKQKYDRLNMPWKSELKWESPYHKIWVGTFRSRLEADRALLKIKEEYKDAFILKP